MDELGWPYGEKGGIIYWITHVYENSNGFSSMAKGKGKLPTHLPHCFHFPGGAAEIFLEEVKKRNAH